MIKLIYSFPRYQRGQAFAETLVGFSVIALFLFGSYHLWRHTELQQAAVDAVRFAAWERVVWEPSDNMVEKFALHKADEQLAKDVVLRQLSTPAAWRNVRKNMSSDGVLAQGSADERRDVLHTGVKSFVSAGQDPNQMISLTTNSGWKNTNEKWRGSDPTGETFTKLKLDKDTWRTMDLTLKSRLTDAPGSNLFRFLLPTIETKKQLSLITNSWAASPPVMFVRDRQLLVLSTGDQMSGTEANPLAFFGQPPSTNANLADIVGMVPLWNIVGGPSGFGGQYLARQTGLSAQVGNELLQSQGQSFQFDVSNPAAAFGIVPQTQQPEYFNSNAVSNWHHRHTFVISKTSEEPLEPDLKAQNSNIGKKKYRSTSLQNPIETYFSR